MIRRPFLIALVIAPITGAIAFACSPFDQETPPGSDAGSGESGSATESDAGKDAEVPTDPPPVPFACDATLCDDFERDGAHVKDGWDLLEPYAERATIDGHHRVSGASALHVTVGADVPDGGAAQASLKKTIDVTAAVSAGAKTFTLDLHLWMNDAVRANLATMALHRGADMAGSGGRVLLVVVNQGRLSCAAQDYGTNGQFDRVVDFPAPQLGRWTHLVMTADFTSPQAVLRCALDDAAPISGDLHNVDLPSSITPAVGVTYAFSPSYSVWFDDVRVDVK